jgi:poly-gamma-glutamate synthesis protein (capsule biosynthesis protein)
MDDNADARTVWLGFVGDLVLGRGVNRRLLDGAKPEAPWGDIRPHMLAAEAMIGNLEGPITTHAKKWPRPKTFRFRADPSVAIGALKAGNFRCVALANNHMLDYRAEGLLDTRRHLAEAGIAFAGAGRDDREAAEPTLFEAGGLRIGFFSITNTVPAFAAKPGRAGTNVWGIRTHRRNLGRLAGMVHDLRRAGAELIVLSVHWGPNYRWWPPRRYRRFARKAIELGVDIVHGHSAHILQAAEFHGNGLILYDTGDFLEDFLPLPGFRSDRSFLFLAEVGPDRVRSLRMIPASLSRAEVNIAKGPEAEAIRAGMIRRCRGYHIALAEEAGALVGRRPGEATAGG